MRGEERANDTPAGSSARAAVRLAASPRPRYARGPRSSRMKSISWSAAATFRRGHDGRGRVRPLLARSAVWVLAAVALPGGALAEPAGAPTPTSPNAGARWTAATPDEMADRMLARARAGGDDALAALAVLNALDDR